MVRQLHLKLELGKGLVGLRQGKTAAPHFEGHVEAAAGLFLLYVASPECCGQSAATSEDFLLLLWGEGDVGAPNPALEPGAPALLLVLLFRLLLDFHLSLCKALEGVLPVSRSYLTLRR